MTHDITDGQKLRMLIQSKLKKQQLTESQKADMQAGTSGDYEPDSLFDAIGEMDDMLHDGNIRALISLYRRLPSLPTDIGIVKIRTNSGKSMLYIKYLQLVQDQFPNLPEGLKIKKVYGPKGINKLYLNMYWEEYTKTIWGNATTLAGTLMKVSEIGVKVIYQTLVRDKVLKPNTRYSLEWAIENLNAILSHYFPSDIATRQALTAMLGNIILDDAGLEALKQTRR